MRHGKAEQTPGIDDFDRGLIDKGMMDVRRQARQVFAQDLPDRFVFSSSIRTTQTVLHVQDELNFSKEIIEEEGSLYLGTVKELLDIVNDLDDRWKSVCLVGHNPGLIHLAEYLTESVVGYLSPSGIVKVTFEGRWAELSKGCAVMQLHAEPT